MFVVVVRKGGASFTPALSQTCLKNQRGYIMEGGCYDALQNLPYTTRVGSEELVKAAPPPPTLMKDASSAYVRNIVGFLCICSRQARMSQQFLLDQYISSVDFIDKMIESCL